MLSSADESIHGLAVEIPTNHREIPGSTPGRYNLQIEITSIRGKNFHKCMQNCTLQNLHTLGPLDGLSEPFVRFRPFDSLSEPFVHCPHCPLVRSRKSCRCSCLGKLIHFLVLSTVCLSLEPIHVFISFLCT